MKLYFVLMVILTAILNIWPVKHRNTYSELDTLRNMWHCPDKGKDEERLQICEQIKKTLCLVYTSIMQN